MNGRLIAGPGLAFAALLVTSCGGTTPAQPTSQPTVAPTPTPVPTPTPLPLTQIQPCKLPAAHGTNDGCYEPKGAEAARLRPEMDVALARVMRERPDLFDFKRTLGSNPFVTDRTAYHVAYSAALSDLGVCANVEKEEMTVKKTNEFSEQWNVWTNGVHECLALPYGKCGYVRRRYLQTCKPPMF